MHPLDTTIITNEMNEIKTMIANTVVKREHLKNQMQTWYEKYPTQHFPNMQELILTDATLSTLDTLYKKLWDRENTKSA